MDLFMSFQNKRFDRIKEVKSALLVAPVRPSYAGMSPSVVNLIVDISLHCDVLAGYASYYVREKSPPALRCHDPLPPGFMTRLQEEKQAASTEQDRLGVQFAEDLAKSAGNLFQLMLGK